MKLILIFWNRDMTILDRDLINEICRDTIYKAVMQSQSVKNKLTLQEHTTLCNYALSIPYKESVELISELGIRDFESNFKSSLKYGAAAIAGGIAGIKVKGGAIGAMAGLSLGVLFSYLFRKTTDPCWLACIKTKPDQKQMCKYICYIKGCDSIISDINKQINRCSATKNPVKCQRSLNKAGVRWKIKKTKYREQLALAKDKYTKKRLKSRTREIKKQQRKIARKLY